MRPASADMRTEDARLEAPGKRPMACFTAGSRCRRRRGRWRSLVPLYLTVLTSCFGGVSALLAGEGAPIKVGDVFPNFAEFALEGELPKQVKGKLVIVDFWASWCGPCRGTFPLMEDLHRRLGKRGLVIVAVNEDKSRVAMTEFLKQHPVSFTIIRDAKKQLAARVNVALMPASYILDGEGKVVSIQSGERTIENRTAFTRLVENLLEKHIAEQP